MSEESINANEHNQSFPHKANKKKATINSLLIKTVIGNESDAFDNKSKAQKLLSKLKENFFISKKIECEDNDSLVLWIQGYDLSEDEISKGYMGNFAKITIIEHNGQFKLKHEKIESDSHPQRIRDSKGKYPNFGHPVLRAAKSKKTYPTFEEARKQLSLLKSEYDDTAFLINDKLLILMIYSKNHQPTPELKPKPIKKYQLEIIENEDGTYSLELKLNLHVKEKSRKIDEYWGSAKLITASYEIDIDSFTDF